MPSVDFARVKELISLEEYLSVLGWKACRNEPTACRGPCVVHGSTNPKSRCLAVNFSRRCWFCQKCKIGGDVIDLYAAINNVEVHQAAIQLCQLFRVAVPELKERRRGTVIKGGQRGQA